MKAIVTQLSGRKAVLLRQDGVFVRTKNRGYRVGQQIGVSPDRRRAFKPALAAACLMLVMLSSAVWAAWALPFSYISVDVNPSLQMTLNWFNRVLTVEAVNGDAQGIVGKLVAGGIEKQSAASAMQMIYSALEDGAYLAGEEDNDVVVAVASYGVKNVSPLVRELAQMQTVQNSGTELSVRTVQVEAAAIAEAKQYETTAGKLAIVKPLAEDSPEETREWLQKPVRDILAASADRSGAEIGTPQTGPEQPAISQPSAESITPPVPRPTPAPSGSLVPAGSPAPMGSPVPTGSHALNASPAPTDSRAPTSSPAPTGSQVPIDSPVPTGSPSAGQQTPPATQTVQGTPDPLPAATPKGTVKPPTAAPKKTTPVPAAAGGQQQSDPAQLEPPPEGGPRQ